MRKLHLPGGAEVDMTEPSLDAKYLAQGLQVLINLMEGISRQLDILIKMECNFTTRKEMKELLVALETENKQKAEEGGEQER